MKTTKNCVKHIEHINVLMKSSHGIPCPFCRLEEQKKLPIPMAKMDEAIFSLKTILNVEQRASLACLILPMASDYNEVMEEIEWSSP